MFAISDFCMCVYLGAVEWKMKGSPVVVSGPFVDSSIFHGVPVVRPEKIIRITDCA